jgi:hypothetical protein
MAAMVHEMGKLRRRFVVVWLTLALVAHCAVAKRIPPKPVAPVVADGIRYSADSDGKDSYVVATDAASGDLLWQVKIFHTRIKFWIEEDVQWVFITNLKLTDKILLVRDEKSRCYSVDLATKHVKKKTCGSAFSS